MNDLRLVLLVAGVAVLAVLWILDARRERLSRRQRTILRGRHADTDSLVTRDTGAGDGDEPTFPDLPPISPRGDALVRAAATTDPEPEAEPAPGADPDPATAPAPGAGYIAVFVQAPGATPFEQARIFAAAEGAGLVFAEPGVFNMPGTVGGPLFTLANVHEPGTFSRAPDARPTRGLALIMRLPTPDDGHMALDLMLHTGELLATDLQGALVDERRRPLDRDAVEKLHGALGAQRRP